MPERLSTLIAAVLVGVQLAIGLALWSLRRYLDRLISDLDKCRDNLDDLYRKHSDCDIDRIDERTKDLEKDLESLTERINRKADGTP